MNTTFFLLLLVFGSLARAPSKECGRCLLTKLGLAQFASGLFWRFGEQRHLAVNIFDALSPHTVAARYTRPIHTTRHNALSRNTLHSKAASQCPKTGGFALVSRTIPSARSIVGAVEPEDNAAPQLYTRRLI